MVSQQTVRQKILTLLGEGECTVRDISQAVGISEKDVYAHLEHLRRSLRHHQQHLLVRPAACLSCGFLFSERSRMTPPGRCPRCRKSHIQHPSFLVK